MCVKQVIYHFLSLTSNEMLYKTNKIEEPDFDFLQNYACILIFYHRI